MTLGRQRREEKGYFCEMARESRKGFFRSNGAVETRLKTRRSELVPRTRTTMPLNRAVAGKLALVFSRHPEVMVTVLAELATSMS